MTTAILEPRPVLGLAAFFFAAFALIAVCLHISDIFAEPEQKSAATAIGEFAAEVRQSARRALSGDPAPAAEPVAQTWSADRMLVIAVPVLAAIAVTLGAIGIFRREPPTLPGMAIAMGGGAFIMLYVFWLALLICGVALMIAIIGNIGEILGA